MIVAAFGGFSSADMEASKKFYGETLGLQLAELMDGIQLDVGGHKVFIYPKEDHVPASFTVLNFVVDSIDDAVHGFAGKGVSFERYENLPAPQDKNGVLRGKDFGDGPNIAWFRDPSGNILALVEE